MSQEFSMFISYSAPQKQLHAKIIQKIPDCVLSQDFSTFIPYTGLQQQQQLYTKIIWTIPGCVINLPPAASCLDACHIHNLASSFHPSPLHPCILPLPPTYISRARTFGVNPQFHPAPHG